MSRYADTRGPNYKAQHREAVARYQQKQRAAGRCVQCAEPATSGMKCDTCAQLGRELRRQKHTPVETGKLCGSCRLPGHNRRTCEDRWEAGL